MCFSSQRWKILKALHCRHYSDILYSMVVNHSCGHGCPGVDWLCFHSHEVKERSATTSVCLRFEAAAFWSWDLEIPLFELAPCCSILLKNESSRTFDMSVKALSCPGIILHLNWADWAEMKAKLNVFSSINPVQLTFKAQLQILNEP